MSKRAGARTGRILIGTSGWSYPHWLKGAFYPPGVRGGECLPWYAQHFPTVEINSTYYRPPREGWAARWAAETSPQFVFAVKMWRQVTHEKRLAGVEEELETHFAASAALGEKFGPLLVQLPPSLEKDLPLLEDFAGACLRAWERHFPRRRLLAAMEFRHASWDSGDARALLAKLGLSLVLSDLAGCTIDEPLAEGLVYVRRHGPGGHAASYGDAELDSLAERIRDWSAAGRDVHVYFNNDVHAHAPRNAAALIAMVRRGRPASRS